MMGWNPLILGEREIWGTSVLLILRMNQVGTEAWVLASYMKIIGQYEASLKAHPNPPMFSLTKFSR